MRVTRGINRKLNQTEKQRQERGKSQLAESLHTVLDLKPWNPGPVLTLGSAPVVWERCVNPVRELSTKKLQDRELEHLFL